MNVDETEQFTPLLEGGEGLVKELSEYLFSLGIQNKLSLVEDCQPGS